MQDELISCCSWVLDLLADFGLTDFYLERRPVTWRSPSAPTRLGESDRGTTHGCRDVPPEPVLDPGGAAFYAPKISVQAH